MDEAIACYEEVLKGGVIEPAVNFNLGLLYQQKLQFEGAIAQFQQSASSPQYRLGSLFALGECYRALGRVDEALTHFLEVLKIVDLSTVRQEQADDLIRLYDELAHTYAARGTGTGGGVYQRADFVPQCEGLGRQSPSGPAATGTCFPGRGRY